MDNHPMIL